MRLRRAAVAGCMAAAITAAVVSPEAARAQSLREDLRLGGYYLNVATGALEGPFTPSGVTDFQRLRLMASPDVGPLHFDIAYEQALSLLSDPALGLSPVLGVSSTGIDWLPLQWTIEDWDHGSW
ncbi:MAG: hypothetical protein KAJ13_09310, partial [Gemmatimonadetes bacterium]|nr:hypothetical protein [Gemmatimonadota bacterium]